MNRSWVLLAAAAAVLAVVAGVWLGLPDGSQPVPGGIDRPLPSATPSVGTTATEPPADPEHRRRRRRRTSTTAGALAILPVYYAAPIGDDARIVRLYREWLTASGVTPRADDQVRARAAVELAMTATPPGTDGYLRTWDGVDLLGVSVTGARITITLSGPGTTAFPEDTERVAVQQLVWTAQAAVGKGTIPVRFELADGSGAMFGTQPVDRTYNRPASRDLYYQDLAPIWVTTPTRGQVLPAGRSVTVRGEACVFEATVSWELLRDGSVVDTGSAMASVGAPGRGTYDDQARLTRARVVRRAGLRAERRGRAQGLGRDDDAVHRAVSAPAVGGLCHDARMTADHHDTDAFRGATFRRVDLAGASLREVDLSGATIRDSDVTRPAHRRVRGRRRVTDRPRGGGPGRRRRRRRHATTCGRARPPPPRAGARARDALGDDVRAAWAVVDPHVGRRGRPRRERARAAAPRAGQGEWSFVETVRHLVFADDIWVGPDAERRARRRSTRWDCPRPTPPMPAPPRWV